MGDLKVIYSGTEYTDSQDPAQDLNQRLAIRFKTEILKIPGGAELLADALAAGDITINLTIYNKMVPFGAQWDAKKREIAVVIPNLPHNDDLLRELPLEPSPDQEILFYQNLQSSTFKSVLFELCNAANPLLQAHDRDKSVLLFPSTEDYVRASEFKEFKSHQRRAKLINAAIQHLHWPNEDGLHEYSDQEFERYYQEVSNVEFPEYGEYKTHANYYRQGYQLAFELIRNELPKLYQQCLTYPSFNMPAGVHISHEEIQSYKELVLQVLQVRDAVDLNQIDTKKLESLKVRDVARQINDATNYYRRSIEYIEQYIAILKEHNNNAKGYLKDIKDFKNLLCKEISAMFHVDDMISQIMDSIQTKENFIVMLEEQKKGFIDALETMDFFQDRESLLLTRQYLVPRFFANKKEMEATQQALNATNKKEEPTLPDPTKSDDSSDPKFSKQ